MSTTIPMAELPSAMKEKLAQISQRQATIAVLRALAVGTSVLCAAMVVSMVIDWQLTLFDTRVRTAMTAVSLILAAISVLISGVPAMISALRRVEAAENADTEIPQLEERWQTVVGLVGSRWSPMSPTSVAMLRQVTSEAVAIGQVVQPRRVADTTKLRSAVKLLALCTAIILAFLAFDWPQTSVLLRRFWSPTANISATSMECTSGDVKIPRGEFVDLTARTIGLPRKSAILSIVRPGSKPEVIELAADAKSPTHFAYRMQADDTFYYRVRAGDGETEWHTVTVIAYPKVAEVKFTIIAPAYLNRPNVDKTVIPGRLKVMQGSMLQLQMRPKDPLKRLELIIVPDSESKQVSTTSPLVDSLTPDPDGWYRFNTQLMQSQQLSLKLWNSHELTNEDPNVCRIQVVVDTAPVARVLNSVDEISVATDDVIDIKFEAHDDYGIAKAELVIYDESAAKEGEPAPILAVLPIDLGDQALEKFVTGTTQLDLKKIDLKPGTQISYAVRVTDNRAVADEMKTLPSLSAQSKESELANNDSSSKRSSSTSTPEKAPSSDGDSKDSRGEPSDDLLSDAAAQTGGDPTIDHPPTESKNELAASNTANSPKSDLAQTDQKENVEDSANPSGKALNKDATNTASLATTGEAVRESLKNRTTVSERHSKTDSKESSSGDSTKTTSKDADDLPSDDASESDHASGNDSESPRTMSPAKRIAADQKAKPSQPDADIGKSDPQTPSKNVDESPSDGKPDETTSKNVEAQKHSDQTADDSDPSEKPKSSKEATPNLPDAPAADKSKKAANGKGNESEEGPPPTRMVAMIPQQSESGQNVETNRRKLKITERLSAVSESREARKAARGGIRERVVEIDELLSQTETGLARVVNREIPDDDRSGQFKILDRELGDVEGRVSDLRKQTRDEEFAFIGLQMVDIGRHHVTPARERIFMAIREPGSAADSSSRSAWQKIIRARELLSALLKRYDRVARERQLADSLKQGVKMYEIYVEKMQQLMREARQNQNPLERKMAVIEVGQDYLDRYADVLTMRREMMAEFGRVLGDDPRLLARYLDLVKRRRTSLRDQLSELSKQQQETSTELSNWLNADANQRDDLWALVIELRMQASTPLAKDAAELAERIERQLPLVLEADHSVQARVVAIGRQIAEVSRNISLEARRVIRQPDTVIDLRPNANQLSQFFTDLDAELEQMSFEKSKEAEVTSYVTGRLLESRTVADQADSWRQISEHLHLKNYGGLAEVDQNRIAITTELLRVDMQGIESELTNQFQQLAKQSVPPEIATQIHELNQIMEAITFEQASATFAMSKDQLKTGETLQKQVNENFAHAEELFDRIRRAVVSALDEMEVRNPTVADLRDPRLDEFLTQLEREPNIEAQLGLPERPRNLRVIADTMMWQESAGTNLGELEEAALARSMQEMQEAKEKAKPNDKPADKPENELTEEDREQRQKAKALEDDLAKTLAELREREKDPSIDPADREKMQAMAKDLQEKLNRMKSDENPDKRWQQLETDLREILESLDQRLKDPSTPAEERQKLEQTAKDLRRTLDQMHKESNPEQRWKQIVELERTKEILKSIARGERIPDDQWNKLISTLDDGLWQVGGRTLPEEFRKAIEQYQERIRRLTTTDETDER